MQIKTFRAESLQEALQLVRLELGPEASVLQTREVKQSRLSVFGKKFIEVEASVEMPIASRLHSVANTVEVSRVQQVASPATHQQLVQVDSDSSQGHIHTDTSAHNPAGEEASPPAHARPPSASRFRNRLRSIGASAIGASKRGSKAGNPSPTATPHQTTEHTTGSIEHATDQETARERAEQTQSHQFPPAAYELVSEMLDHGFPSKVAAKLVGATLDEVSAEQHDDDWVLRGRTGQLLSKQFHTSGPIEPTAGGDPTVIAFMGPTGVGKTTTLAKIAAGFRFDLGLDVGMITIDTFRLGAVDQLLQYAELISAPLEVVSAPEQITGAIQRQRECDVILIDTAGRSPGDAEQLALLGQFLDAAQPDQRHLVLSAASSHHVAQHAIERFGITKPSHMVLSKVDESVCLGSWYDLLTASETPMSYVTTGQHVPQDIVVASGRKLASIMLGSSQYQQPVA